MKSDAIIGLKPLGFLWEVNNPFLFCAHHLDHYPPGNEEMGPAASLRGRNIGQDFTIRDGWRMYHGSTVPGFPAHPHRGFETVTIVLTGLVDHSDSYGQAGRYGGGDVQWMTAGSGLQHSEMFPLLNRDGDNPLELFQVWLNLPKKNKRVEPHFKMLWHEDIPVYRSLDSRGKAVEVTVIAGNIGGVSALSPAPGSWAVDPANQVAIWIIRLEPGAAWALPPAREPATRSLYFYKGDSLILDGVTIESQQSVALKPEREPLLENSDSESYLLLLQGNPIDEPVVQYGPFVMNTEAEIRQALSDFRATEFGGWPWNRHDPVHDRQSGRFARYADGKVEKRG
jgi:redox-sensitive bicupin YhaK (pirin superfamily)